MLIGNHCKPSFDLLSLQNKKKNYRCLYRTEENCRGEKKIRLSQTTKLNRPNALKNLNRDCLLKESISQLRVSVNEKKNCWRDTTKKKYYSYKRERQEKFARSEQLIEHKDNSER
jgi:hypothetical protein